MVTFHSPHGDADLAIDNADNQTMVISFKRGPEDKVDAIIPHDKFGKMRPVKLNTAKAQGSLMEDMKDWAHGKTPAVLEPPRLIFTKTGNYEIVVGSDLRSPNSEIDVCYLYYFDYPKPRAKRADQPPKPTSKR